MSVDSERAFGYNWVIPNRVGRRRVNVPARDTGKVGFPMHGDSTPSLVVVEVKLCHRCGRILPHSQFALSRRNRDGRQTACRDCFRRLYRGGQTDRTRERRLALGEWWLHAEQSADRFWAKVQAGESAECWPWMASTDPKGYGRFNIAYGKVVPAHRVAFVLAGGDPSCPAVMHLCNNPPCCNPAHLRAGTLAENNAYTAECDRTAAGERAYFAKLTESDVQRIRSLVSSGFSQAAVAREIGCHPSNVSRIVNRGTWRRVA